MIKLLDANTIDKIAAGEVIERPMAVVKELVENSIDSGASAITVEIKNGGITFIRITDNGSGIDKEDISLAFMRHATSKIKTIEDLLTVSSLGFRGEALSSIAAVSQVECITKTRDSLQGFQYEIHGGMEKAKEEVGCPDGTTFLVRNLFYNTPARQKFLKSKMTEGNYVSELMERFALSHPEISFKYITDGRVKLQTSGNCNCKNIIYYIYGLDITKALLEVDVNRYDMRVSGFVAKPEVSRGNRAFMNYFINGRYIKSPIISHAIEEAYKGYTMNHRYPFTVLFLEIDSQLIDVNVHPSKMEVRFQNQEEVYQLFLETIREALKQGSLIPEVSFETELKSAKQEVTKRMPQVLEKDYIPEPFETERRKEEFALKAFEIPAEVVRERDSFRFEQVSFQTDEVRPKENQIHFRIIGQIFATYWMIEYNEELLIIDQHAAHEKVLYEKLMKSIRENDVPSQALAVPIIVTLSEREREVLLGQKEMLSSLGFEVSHFGGKEYAIESVPSDFLKLATKELFIDLLDCMLEPQKGTSDMILEKCASMACKAAVKGNQTFSLMEAESLIRQMLTLENPYHCPHGRPTTITITKKEFERKFKRIV